jgi:hypothetical protein
MTKVAASEAYQKAVRWCQQMAGPQGFQFHEPGRRRWIRYARHSGDHHLRRHEQINRNNIAERHLGLPKAR